jgi:cell division protein FtsB
VEEQGQVIYGLKDDNAQLKNDNAQLKHDFKELRSQMDETNRAVLGVRPIILL